MTLKKLKLRQNFIVIGSFGDVFTRSSNKLYFKRLRAKLKMITFTNYLEYELELVYANTHDVLEAIWDDSTMTGYIVYKA